ncbi:hypothetical protein QT982_29425 [Microcoleus sp. herbarium2]
MGNIELWCMVMELIDGIDLGSHLEDGVAEYRYEFKISQLL